MEDLTFGEQVKIILGRKGMTIKELAETIEKETGKKMSRQNLTQRLGRDNFQEQDMRMIAQILGCQFHLSIMVAEGESEETQGETVVRYEQKPKAHKKHISDEGVPEQLELDLFFDKDPDEAEPTESTEAEETTVAQEVASEPEESEEAVMVQEVASEPEESEEAVMAQEIAAEPVEEETADTEEAPVYEEETAYSPEEEAPVYSAEEESAYSTDAEQVSAYSTDAESDSDYETEQIYADRTPAIQVEPLHPETMGEDCNKSAWLPQTRLYRSAGTFACSSRVRVERMASGCTSKASTRPAGAVSPHRKAVSPPLPQVASTHSCGCASRAAKKSCTNLTAVRSGVRRRTSCPPSAAKPNLPQKASSAAFSGSGAVKTVAASRS